MIGAKLSFRYCLPSRRACPSVQECKGTRCTTSRYKLILPHVAVSQCRRIFVSSYEYSLCALQRRPGGRLTGVFCCRCLMISVCAASFNNQHLRHACGILRRSTVAAQGLKSGYAKGAHDTACYRLSDAILQFDKTGHT